MQILKEIEWSRERFSAAVTTGAAVGIAGLTAAVFHRVPAFYFESVSRVYGPSLAGRMATVLPGVVTHCQYENWANKRWTHRPSLFESYSKISKASEGRPRIFVTLGTNKTYRFDSLVDATLATGLADDRTVWQLGATTRTGLPGSTYAQLNAAQFERFVRDADVVIAHAGVGTIMGLLDMGVYPVIVPRRAARREVVDDHQAQIAGLLQARGIALVVDPEDLTANLLYQAALGAIRTETCALEGDT